MKLFGHEFGGHGAAPDQSAELNESRIESARQAVAQAKQEWENAAPDQKEIWKNRFNQRKAELESLGGTWEEETSMDQAA